MKDEADEIYQSGYEDGLLEGSKIGDATAKNALRERDADMSRFQGERLELYHQRTKLEEKLNAMGLLADDHAMARVGLSKENAALKSLIRHAAEMTLELETRSRLLHRLAQIEEGQNNG